MSVVRVRSVVPTPTVQMNWEGTLVLAGLDIISLIQLVKSVKVTHV